MIHEAFWSLVGVDDSPCKGSAFAKSHKIKIGKCHWPIPGWHFGLPNALLIHGFFLEGGVCVGRGWLCFFCLSI